MCCVVILEVTAGGGRACHVIYLTVASASALAPFCSAEVSLPVPSVPPMGTSTPVSGLGPITLSYQNYQKCIEEGHGERGGEEKDQNVSLCSRRILHCLIFFLKSVQQHMLICVFHLLKYFCGIGL